MEDLVMNRTMPNNLEAEKSVLGSMLMDKEAIVVASEIVKKEDFYSQHYGSMFESMVELYNEGLPVDPVTLQNRIMEKGLPEQFTGADRIREILISVPTSANVKHYANIVQEKSMARKLIRVTEGIANECYLGNENLDTIMNDTEKQIFSLLQNRTAAEYIPISEIVITALDRIEQAANNKSSVTGISTGFTDLDLKTSGLQPADLVLLAARPSMGKTAFVLNIAQYIASHQKLGTVVFSLEMSKEQLVNRLLSVESRVDAQMIRNGTLKEAEWLRLVEAAGVIGDSGLIIDDTPGISISELRSKCRKYSLEHGLKLIIIDYLQLMSGSGKNESRQQEISDISRSLKSLARELKVPVLALSQLSRQVEQRPDHRPMLSDLRESGAIEQDADVVMFLYRDDYYNKDTEQKNVAELIIAKQRNGPTGTIELVWLPEYTKFANMER